MILRQYQKDCCNAVYKGWKEYQRLLAVMPTGSGKTICFSKLAEYYVNKHDERILILAHREELIQQAVDKLHRSCAIDAGIERAGDTWNGRDRVVVGSVQSVSARLDRIPNDAFQKIIIDEAHHSLASSYTSIAQHFTAGGAKFLGVTATPDRGDRKNLGSFFEDIAYEIGLFDLIHQEYLAPITVRSIPLKIDLSSVGYSHGDYQINDLASALDPYLAEASKHVAALANAGRKCLVFLPLIATSEKFTALLQNRGVVARHIDGKDDERQQKLKDFASGRIKVLCNAMLLSEGYDEPSVDCIVILRPTASRSLYSQMVGRGTRIAEGKKDLLLLDFLWLHEKHNLMRPAHLVSKDDEIAKAVTKMTQPVFGFDEEAKDLEMIYAAAVRQREEKLRVELAKKANRQNKVIDALEVALQFGEHDLVDWEPTMEWHNDPVTAKQRQILTRFGVNPNTVKGKGHANSLLGLLFARSKKKLATPKQAKLLARLGHPNAMNATIQEAKEWLSIRLR